jgi:hypothetical protein
MKPVSKNQFMNESGLKKPVPINRFENGTGLIKNWIWNQFMKPIYQP